MNYKEELEKSQKRLETVRIKKAQVTEKLKGLAEQLGLDTKKPLGPQIEELEKSYETRKAELDGELAELEKQFKELEDGVSDDKGESN